jgi:3'-phosphoadenosine 5'-phosphosulfate sulfotransferase (PAPS reductase)/FAD synthetase
MGFDRRCQARITTPRIRAKTAKKNENPMLLASSGPIESVAACHMARHPTITKAPPTITDTGLEFLTTRIDGCLLPGRV